MVLGWGQLHANDAAQGENADVYTGLAQNTFGHGGFRRFIDPVRFSARDASCTHCTCSHGTCQGSKEFSPVQCLLAHSLFPS